MIRIEEPDGWTLVEHRDHARLAGAIAHHWRNADFAPPEPVADVMIAVARHDDAWAARDASPCLTREGRPSAFSHELVGTYSAFEEIDLEDYLSVRGQAAETVAAENPYAAILISMHTVNLLTEQADLPKLSPAQRAMHGAFVERQRRRQTELAAAVAADARRAGDVEPARLQRAFEFLQACDSLSLIACVRYPRPIALRHRHPDRSGTRHALHCTPLGEGKFRVAPYPFDVDALTLRVPARRIAGRTFLDPEVFRAAHRAAPRGELPLTIVR